MFKRVLGTFSNKVVAMISSFLLVVLTSRYLGAAGKGEISLFIANIVMIQHVGNFVAGSALVYFTPRVKPIILLIPAYIWSILSTFLVVAILVFFNPASSNLISDLIILSIINNIITTNYMILLGREEVKKYNLLTLLTTLLTISYLLYSFFLVQEKEVYTYIKSLYLSYTVVLLLSIFYIRKEFVKVKLKELKSTVLDVVSYGFRAQISNIITFINYRFSYYVLSFKFSNDVLGVYSVGVALSEALWLMSKSIALIQYTKIVNENDHKKSQELTVSMAKVSFWVTLLFLILLLIVPEFIFQFIFGNDFGNAKQVIYTLGFGIISISISTTFAHYFGGIARYDINNKASLVGLVVTLSLTYVMVEKYEMIGAGISTSLAYFASATYQYFQFRKEANFKLNMLMLTREDLKFLLDNIKKMKS